MNSKVQPMLPDNPEQYEWERERIKSDKEEWRGCQHCGRTVPIRTNHIIFVTGPDRNLYMHMWCHMKLYERDYAKALFGKDIFGEVRIFCGFCRVDWSGDIEKSTFGWFSKSQHFFE